ncbi:ABC transporter substrate-binding protein [Leucobacter weissii]|uniref:ABC transporter substrate-binding protein n=1 Tax=Leucobacter weissii TaxID=1983706 RepID=A0A939MLD7_9MICO|nr:ABC transporter substrate-binding protein [Leucobacter weissii]MBO1902390.1 ABC transporter substrate-binding protein [Leucobacter weissii]
MKTVTPASRLSAITAALTGAALLLTACASPSQSDENADTGALVVDTATAPSTFDPAIACNLVDISLLSDLYQTLVTYEVDDSDPSAAVQDQNEIVPALAEEWEVSDDGLTYTFTLQEGVEFPSGAPVDAEAVLYSWNRAFDLGGCGAYFLSSGKSESPIDEITAPDDRTVVVTLTERANNFLPALTNVNTGIIDRTVLEAEGGDTAEDQSTWLATHSAGSGPYTLESYSAGERAVYTANPAYSGSAPISDRVEINFISDDASLLLRARNSTADVTLGLSKQAVSSLEGDENVRIVSTPAPQWTKFDFPLAHAPFDDVRVREALSYAVPYQEILDKVAFGYGATYFGPYPPEFSAYDETIGAPREEDLARARELLDEAGIDTPVELPVYIRSGQTDQENVATILQSAWKDLGIELDVQILTASAYQEAISSDVVDYALIGTDGPAVVDPEWLLSYDYTSNEAANDLLAEAADTADEAARQELWNEIAELWIADVPRIPLYAQDDVVVVGADLSSFASGQSNTLFHLWGK